MIKATILGTATRLTLRPLCTYKLTVTGTNSSSFILNNRNTRYTRPSHCKMASTNTDQARYLLSFYVPKEDTKKVMSAVHETGAGTYPDGLYGECAFITPGQGTFRPLQGANPAIGKVGDTEQVEENKVEILCVGRELMKSAVAALKKAHPYETVAFMVTSIENV